jgi:polysaccharide pyruvyl transferase WcaK-like protein
VEIKTSIAEGPTAIGLGGERANKKRVGVFGHFGMSNFGNDSTLYAILYHLRHRIPDVEVNCICTGPAAARATYDVAATPISGVVVKGWRPKNRVAKTLRAVLVGVPSELYRWMDAFRTLGHTDALIIPGTGLLNDAFGLLNWGPYSLFKWSLVAKMRGCKVLFVSVGAGPLYGRLGKWIVRAALALADFRSYRDRSSMQYLMSIGFTRTADRIYPDLVFSLPEAIIPRAGGATGHRKIVGIGLMEYAGRYSVANPSQKTYDRYLDTLATLVHWLLEREYDVRILTGDACDRAVTQDFIRLLRHGLPENDVRRILDEPITSVQDLLSQLAGTDLVVATRFHNVLCALLCDKPTLSISFHHKCTSLMEAMGLSEYCLDISQLDSRQLIERVMGMESNNDALKILIKERVQQHRADLEQQYELIAQKVWPRRI